MAKQLTIQTEQEQDGRWIAEIPSLPGVMVYASSPEAAVSQAKALALRVLAEKIEHGEEVAEIAEFFAIAS